KTLFAFALLFTLVQQQCDLSKMTADQIQAKTTEGIRPYFPQAVVIVAPKAQAIIALTCSKNIGHEMVLQIARQMPQQPQVQQLRLLRFLSYKRLVLEFDHEAISLEVDRNLQPFMMGIPNQAKYEQDYSRTCGF